jgi:DNA glycosylase AlkZ-like
MADTLGYRALNRATMERQILLRRERAEPLKVVERLVGMQAQEPLDPYYGLWSRLEGFEPSELAGLVERGEAVRLVVMRGTLHLVTSADALELRALTQPVMERFFTPGAQWGRSIAAAGSEPGEVAAAAREILDREELPAAGVAERLAARWPEADRRALAAAANYLLPVVQVPPRGVWGKGTRRTLTTVKAYIGRDVLKRPSMERVIRRYLAAYGPASAKDIQSWCGLTRLREVTDEMSDLRRLRNTDGRELLDLPDATLPDPHTPAPVRFLPQYDNVVFAYADRERLVADMRLKPVPTKIGYRTFLVDGFLAGFWRPEGKGEDMLIEIEPARRLAKADREAVAEEAVRLMAFASDGEATGDVRFLPPARRS